MARTKKIEVIEKQAEKVKNKIGIGEIVNNFIIDIQSLSSTLPQVMVVIQKQSKYLINKFDNFIKNHATDSEKNKIKITIDDMYYITKLTKDVTTSIKALDIIPKSLLVSLISIHDGYLSNLLKLLFLLKQDSLNYSDKQIPYAQLIEFDTLDNARDYIIEREIESIMRESHIEQFKYMENKFNLPLRKDLQIWPKFVEISERRNLFVHCDGAVSRQYLNVCKTQNVQLKPEITLGKTLNVTPDYFKEAYRCIFEIDIKLAHVLWRKLFKEDRDHADHNLIDISFDLLTNENYSLAKIILDFATEIIKSYSKDEVKRIFVVNKAIAYKFSNNESKAKEILNSEDWSSCSLRFKLALEVLRDNYIEAAKTMKLIGSHGELSKLEYKEWPLFKEFRKSKYFLNTYKELFKEEFTLLDLKSKKIKE